jgi:hypothetical protein
MLRRSGITQRSSAIGHGKFDWKHNLGESARQGRSQRRHARWSELGMTLSPCRRFIEATRTKEIQAVLKFGRDSSWPLRITEAAVADWITQPPAFQREGAKLDLNVRKENNAIRILARETAVDGSRPITPDDPGLPVMLPYAPNAVIKLRSHSGQVLPSLEDCVFRLHQGRMRLVESLATKEWAMAGSLGNDEPSGVVPPFHRAQPIPEALPTVSAFYQMIHEAGPKTQNYDNGLISSFGSSTVRLRWFSRWQ